MSEEKDKQQKNLNYRPDIKYEEEYDSLYNGDKIDFSSSFFQPDFKGSEGILYDNSIMFLIEDNINNIIRNLNSLPEKVQTAVNQVFKPIYNEWYDNLRDESYPEKIPNPDVPIIRPKPNLSTATKPSDHAPSLPSDSYIPDNESSSSNKDNDNGDVFPNGSEDLNKPYDPDSSMPDVPSKPNDSMPNTPGGTIPNRPGDAIIPPSSPPGNIDPYIPAPQIPEPPKLNIWTPNIDDPILEKDTPTGPNVNDSNPLEDPGDLFFPDTPFEVIYEEIEESEVIRLEYIKNLADLMSFYTSKLNDTLNRHVISQYNAFASTETAEDLIFLLDDIKLEDVSVDKDLKHLMDTGVRQEILGNNKLDFCINNFPLESSLYHLKNFKASYGLRIRYAEQSISDAANGGSMSNSILRAMKEIYSEKYDSAYINLYKYLNSSVEVLDDVIKTLDVGLKSKETLIKKGGYKK